ncbi:MAG: sodium:solute symporter [Halobacteria archaeon]
MALEPEFSLIYPVAGYLALMAVIGGWAYTKVDNTDDLVVAGRTLGSAVVAGSLLATWMGGGSVTGGSNSIAFKHGLIPGMLLVVGSLTGIGILAMLAPKIRDFNKLTVPSILDEGLGSEARFIGLVVISIAYVGIVAEQLQGLGLVLQSTTGLDVQTGRAIAMVFIIGLTMVGGLMSVAYTDAISAFLIVFGIPISIPFVLSAAGGWDHITQTAPKGSLTLLGDLSTLQFLGLWLPSILLVMGDQNMYQRIVAGESDTSTKKAMAAWFVGALITGIAIPIVAFSARSMFPNIRPGNAMISTTTVIPFWIGGILLAAATAFMITTGTSYLLSASSNISEDLYKGLINQDAPEKRVFWLTRAMILVFGLIAFVLMEFVPSILDIQIQAYTAYGATITPALLAIFLMRKRLTKWGGISGMLVGFSTTLIWEDVLMQPFDIHAVVVSAPLAAIVIIVVSFLTNDGTD